MVCQECKLLFKTSSTVIFNNLINILICILTWIQKGSYIDIIIIRNIQIFHIVIITIILFNLNYITDNNININISILSLHKWDSCSQTCQAWDLLGANNCSWGGYLSEGENDWWLDLDCLENVLMFTFIFNHLKSLNWRWPWPSCWAIMELRKSEICTGNVFLQTCVMLLVNSCLLFLWGLQHGLTKFWTSIDWLFRIVIWVKRWLGPWMNLLFLIKNQTIQ
jgi:hypothetical protein